MFYAFRVNHSLARLGVRPMAFTLEYRTGMQKIGAASGFSPQEIALIMTSQLPVMHLTGFDVAPLRAWIRTRKINPKSSEIRDALSKLGLFDAME